MNKKELLSKLSIEELKCLQHMKVADFISEIANRQVKTNDIKVGNCFISRPFDNEVVLTKITGIGSYDYYNFDEISIDENEVVYYNSDCRIDEFDGEYLDPNIFDKAYALVEARENAVDKVTEQFNKQIRELVCLI